MPLSPPPQLRNPFGKYSSPACHEDDHDDHGDNDDEARHQINDGSDEKLGHGTSYIFCQRAILNNFLTFMKCQKVLLALSQQYPHIHILHLKLFLSLFRSISNHYQIGW